VNGCWHGCPGYGGIYDHLYLDIYPPSIQPTTSGHVLRRQAVRPVAYAPGVHDVPAVLADDGRPLVYATFGTELPDQRPLKTVVEAISSLDVRVLATIGPRGNLDAFGPQPANVTIMRYVPQTAVLPHAAAVVSHAGSGTVLAALAAGVPQLCLPHFADQPLNASAVADAGAGLTLDVTALDHHTIRKSVSRLLAEGTFRSQALASGMRSQKCRRPKMSLLCFLSSFTRNPFAAAEPGAAAIHRREHTSCSRHRISTHSAHSYAKVSNPATSLTLFL